MKQYRLSQKKAPSPYNSGYNLSINTIRFFLNLRRFLIKKQISLDDFLNRVITQNPNEINQVQFVKIINISETKFSSIQIYGAFGELKSGLGISRRSFLERYYIIDQSHPLDKMNNIQQQSPKIASQNSLSQAQKDIQKKLMKLGLLKLQNYVRENSPFELFQECDDQNKGYLTKQQFNKFLISTDIKQLNDKTTRQALIKKLFAYYKDQRMGKQSFGTLFKINIQEQKQKQRQRIQSQNISNNNKNKVQMNNPFLKQPTSPVYPNLDDKKFVKQPAKNNLVFQCKNVNDEISSPSNLPQIKYTKSQSFQSQQIDVLDARSTFPRSYMMYRLGVPSPDEFPVFQNFQNYLAQGKIFVDHDNPKSKLGQYTPSSTIFAGKRYDIFQMAPSVLNRQKSRIGLARQIQPKDIIQGQVGDCYLLSSIASIISIYPQVISERFMFSANPSHFYAVKLFIDGQWQIFCTDDQFPCQNNKPVYAKPHGNQIWVLLIQKCWAKAFGSYERIDSGTPTQGFRALTGAPTEYFVIENQQEQKQMYNRLKQVYDKRYVATASGSTILTALGEKQQQKIGLIADHAYSFLKFLSIQGQTVVKMRNPWGKTVWKGQWSFQSKKWTKELRNKFNYNCQPNDGSFYMPWNLFMKYFSNFVICRIDPTSTHTSAEFISKPHKSTYFKIIIQQSGCYNFGVYQPSKRKINSPNYQYSQTRIIVANQRKGDIKYIASANKSSHGIFCEEKVQPGVYYIAIKVNWEQKQIFPLKLAVYGSQKADIQQIDNSIAPFFKKGVVQSFANMKKGKIKTYEKLKIPQAYNQVHFSLNQGLGFIKVKNPTQKSFCSTYSLNKCEGIKPIKPAKLPYKFDMQPHSEIIIGFWVSCKGYSYESSQSMETKRW